MKSDRRDMILDLLWVAGREAMSPKWYVTACSDRSQLTIMVLVVDRIGLPPKWVGESWIDEDGILQVADCFTSHCAVDLTESTDVIPQRIAEMRQDIADALRQARNERRPRIKV